MDEIWEDFQNYQEYSNNLKFLSNIEEIKKNIFQAFGIISDEEINIKYFLNALTQNIKIISKFVPDHLKAMEFLNNIEANIEEIEVIYSELDSRLDFSEEDYISLSEKVDKYNRIIRKYGGTFDAVLEHKRKIDDFFQNCLDFDKKIKALKAGAY